ncbi:GNAT family N-acetyltransferase [Rhizobiales bacterium]|uniref:GNAT family N-acetyltransferase n=1 Tax=Hongsoonwoonella zoysiae TaxID=2821844 RepID=UPI0015602902|nr:GNAT family N-acetyltransferase [Hongsoonwoonella zoysiae]NRG17681.1 GNAT family N-acetyltransferase [Hongsoonwoonella zoysiae]
MSIRPAEPRDIENLIAINEAAVPAVNSLEAAELARLIAMSARTLVSERNEKPAGFVLCLDETADYDSRNFLWLKRNFERFFYVDRIAVSPEARGLGLGEKLYDALVGETSADGTCAGAPLTCEVNERPPNPGSLRFHKRLGFLEVGRQDLGDKAVVYLARELIPARTATETENA